MEIIRHKINHLEIAADQAGERGDYDEMERIDNEVSALWKDNEERISAAKDALAKFSDEVRASAIINAADTFIENGEEPDFYCCEYWEIAKNSAAALVDDIPY